MTDQLKSYKGWKIYRDTWPFPAWCAYHSNYDASWEGEEDGWVDNGLKAYGNTYEELIIMIEEKEDDLVDNSVSMV